MPTNRNGELWVYAHVSFLFDVTAVGCCGPYAHEIAKLHYAFKFMRCWSLQAQSLMSLSTGNSGQSVESLRHTMVTSFWGCHWEDVLDFCVSSLHLIWMTSWSIWSFRFGKFLPLRVSSLWCFHFDPENLMKLQLPFLDVFCHSILSFVFDVPKVDIWEISPRSSYS